MYLWNSGSWDIQAIYPESISDQGSYRDPYLVDLIGGHNRQVAAQDEQSPSSTSSTAGRRLLGI